MENFTLTPFLPQLCYVYDNADRLTTINRGTGANCATGLTQLETFTYDDANRRLTLTLQSNSIVGTYTYSNADELTSITYTKGATTLGDVTYTYDTSGRIASRGGSLFKSVLPAATTATAVYNAANQMTSKNGTAFTYDLNGNWIQGGSRTLTWDARNRLLSLTNVGTFAYDALGRRLSVTKSGTTVTTLYDGYDPVQEQSPAGTVSADLQTGLGVDERFSRTKSGTTSTYLTDLLGSTVALADASGVVQTRYGYDPYGVTSQTGAANDNQYQFTGRQQDGDGYYYYRGRYYQPAWGRFISEDPIGLAGGVNLYAYVGGSPTDSTDPSGEIIDTLADAAFIGFDVYELIKNGRCSLGTNLLILSADVVGALIPGVTGLGEGVRTARGAVEGLSFTRRQLQHAFKHSNDFGVSGNVNNKTLSEFSSAIQSHVNAPGTQAIEGSYRGNPVTHHVNPETGVNVIQGPAGDFVSGWKLSPAQLGHVTTTGKLGGG